MSSCPGCGAQACTAALLARIEALDAAIKDGRTLSMTVRLQLRAQRDELQHQVAAQVRAARNALAS